MQLQENVYKIPCRPREVVNTDVFIINNKTLLWIVDYHSKLPIVKTVNSLSADILLQMNKLIFAEYGLPKKIIPDAGKNLHLRCSNIFVGK